MNLPVPVRTDEPRIRSVITTDTILLLCGTLFGLCLSGTIDPRMKFTFVFAGTTGLLAYLALGFVRQARQRSQQRVAIQQVEQRLDRHASSGRGDSAVNIVVPRELIAPAAPK